MNFLILGFFTGFSLILVIGPQNIFVIEQGLKKNFIFIVCLICSLSDILLIYFGIFLFSYFQFFSSSLVELILNVLLILFLLNFIWKKWNEKIYNKEFNTFQVPSSLSVTIFRTFSFTYLNPHVYSDTLFFLGNFSKDFLTIQKIYFGMGASFSSLIFFFSIGYLAKYFSKYLKNYKVWKIINFFIIIFMFFIIIFLLINKFYFFV